MEPTLIPVTEPDKFSAHGIPWRTEDQARWAFRNRESIGLTDAFTKIGRRIYLNPQKFHEITGGHKEERLGKTAAIERKIASEKPQMSGPLTKREHIATAMMQGFLSSGRFKDSEATRAAYWSVIFADALIAELAETR